MNAKMNEEVGRQWVAELRSGKWEQTKERLGVAGSNQRCCLGVLQECAEAAGEIPRESRGITEFGGVYEIQFLDRTPSGEAHWKADHLTHQVADWAGLESVNPAVEVLDRGRVALAELNDDGATFAEIADLIEDQLLGGPEAAQ